MAVGVTREDEHVEGLAGEVEGVSLVHQHGRLDGRDRKLVLLVGRALGVGERHAVGQQIALEAGSRVEIEPRAHRQLAIAGALHDLLDSGQLGQAGARADVIRVVVRDHEATDARVSEQSECLFPAAAGSGGAEPAVDQRPALGVVDRVAVHVVECPRQRLRDAVDATAELLHLELAPRACAQGAVRP